MKGGVVILFLLLTHISWSQKVQVIVPTQPVVIGTAFQVQYVITNPSEYTSATTPVFDSCRLISGPNTYKGNTAIEGKLQPIQNITYTLVPTKVGLLKIGGIKVSFKNLRDVQSTDAGINVVSQPKASFSVRSSYTDVTLYAPSLKKDREKLIRENLFIKAEVDRKECYVGEPVVATYKLYSRLQSSSEAEKSPAFYGFSVIDMLDINEAHTAVETVDGKIFNTSILRQVQLYPAQAGRLVIDEMYVHNEIEFDDSITHGKTTVEKEIVTKPVIVTVKSLPANKPENFTGAVGNFDIEAHLDQKEVFLNGQGKLIVTINGDGNFIQFGQPVINWLRGIEPFEPTVIDKLNKSTSPIKGKRTYEFGFAVDSTGNYSLEPVSFSFFDLKTASFKQLTTDSLQFTVVKADRRVAIDAIKESAGKPYVWVILALIIVAIVSIVMYKRKNKRPYAPQLVTVPPKSKYIQQVAALDIRFLTEKQTCLEIQKLLFSFYQEKSSLLSAEQKKEIQALLQDCQLQIYSYTDSEGKKEEMKKRALRFLKSL